VNTRFLCSGNSDNGERRLAGAIAQNTLEKLFERPRRKLQHLLKRPFFGSGGFDNGERRLAGAIEAIAEREEKLCLYI